MIDPDLAAARKLNEELFRVATSSDAMKVWTKFAIDLFEAVLCDPAFGSEFMTTRYPQMRDQIERRRQRRKR